MKELLAELTQALFLRKTPFAGNALLKI